MECRRVQGRLADYADGHLYPEQRAAVEAHLGRCLDCRESLAETRAFLAGCREALACPTPAYSFAALRARMAQVRPLDEVIRFVPKLRTGSSLGRVAVAMVLAVLILGAPAALRHARAVFTAAKHPVTDYRARIAQTYDSYLDDDHLLPEEQLEDRQA